MGERAEDLAILVADLEGVRTLVGWAVDEGWGPGAHDAEAFHAADPKGFLLGWLDGEPVAGISFVHYEARLGVPGPVHRPSAIPRARPGDGDVAGRADLRDHHVRARMTCPHPAGTMLHDAPLIQLE